MRMLLYYFFRSTWNQLKKLVRTWAFIMLIVMVTIGGLVVYAVRWYYQRLSTVEGLLPDSFMDFFEIEGLSRLNAAELVVGLLILGVLVIQIIGAEKSVSRLFMQADVNLLFASPLSPQKVLLFRLMNTLGMALAVLAVLFFEIPFFKEHFELSFYGAFSIPLAWLLLLAFSVLLKALIYEIGSRHPFFRKNLRWFVFGVLGILGGLFCFAYKQSGGDALILTAHRFMNGRFYIPVWGWIKGFLVFAWQGNILLSLTFLFLCLSLIFAFLALSLHLPTDYYEDTLTRTEEIALLIEGYKQDGVQTVAAYFTHVKNIRDGEEYHYGHGSSVYFYKALFNRFRSYPSRIRALFFTRTGITYLIAAAAAGWFDRKFMDPPVIYIPVLLLAAMVFFRTIFSPVTEDIRKASFLMQPGPVWSRLFFSILGGSCSCALDTALPLMIGSWTAGFSPLEGLLFLPALMGVDFFAASAGAFTEVSLPQSIGMTFRQVIQILLLYMGLIFDGMILTSGITGGYLGGGFLLVTVVNLVFGLFFLGLTGVWLYPCGGRAPKAYRESPDAKKVYSMAGLALAGMYLAIHLSRLFFFHISLPPVFSVYAPIYLIGFPVFVLFFRPHKSAGREEAKLPLPLFFLLVPVCFFVMYGGSIVGSLFNGLLQLIRPFPPVYAGQLTMDNPALQAFFLAGAAPVMEEYVFRRCLIERLLPYGSRTAVVVSALLFGLFHSTVSQVCYAFMLGLIFGYVYVQTRRLRYTVALHILINALTSIVLPAILMRITSAGSFSEMSRQPVTQVLGEPGVMWLLLYLVVVVVCSLSGAVLFFFGIREKELPREGVSSRCVLSAWGMIVFIVIAVAGIYAGL